MGHLHIVFVLGEQNNVRDGRLSDSTFRSIKPFVILSHIWLVIHRLFTGAITNHPLLCTLQLNKRRDSDARDNKRRPLGTRCSKTRSPREIIRSFDRICFDHAISLN